MIKKNMQVCGLVVGLLWPSSVLSFDLFQRSLNKATQGIGTAALMSGQAMGAATQGLNNAALVSGQAMGAASIAAMQTQQQVHQATQQAAFAAMQTQQQIKQAQEQAALNFQLAQQQAQQQAALNFQQGAQQAATLHQAGVLPASTLPSPAQAAQTFVPAGATMLPMNSGPLPGSIASQAASLQSAPLGGEASQASDGIDTDDLTPEDSQAEKDADDKVNNEARRLEDEVKKKFDAEQE